MDNYSITAIKFMMDYQIYLSSISNVIGDTVDTLIRNLKLAHID